MCNWKPLKNSANGYVMLCNSCNRIQLAFGTTVLSVNRMQFYDFLAVVETTFAKYGPDNAKWLHLPLPAANVAMVCTGNELAALLAMLKEGRARLQYNELLIINKN